MIAKSVAMEVANAIGVTSFRAIQILFKLCELVRETYLLRACRILVPILRATPVDEYMNIERSLHKWWIHVPNDIRCFTFESMLTSMQGNI